MNQLLRTVIASLVVCQVSLSAGQAPLGPLGDVAREAEKRKDTGGQPAKTYTNDDLRTAEPGRATGGCQSADHKYDPASGKTYLSARCSDGSTRIQGSNTRTGASWRLTIKADGSQSGTDSCGSRWTYDPQTRSARNESGETRQGEAAFHERLETSAACATPSAPERSAAASTSQSGCTETLKTDTSGNRYVVYGCGGGLVRESGTDLNTGTLWQNTILPDGSLSGSNSCGVSWKYDAKTDRYETSLGEQGMGRAVFLANIERIRRCRSTLLQ